MVDRARYIIIGGGVLGCSLAYHLASAGQRGILVVDQGEIAGGTTSQGAGLIGQVRGSVAQTNLILRTCRSIGALCERGLDPGWHPVGSLRVSLCQARDEEFDHLFLTALKAEVPVSFIAPAEAEKLFPGLSLRGGRRILWCPSDGYVSAPQLARCYAAAARQLGVEFAAGTRLVGFLFDAERAVQGIRTSAGEVRASTVIVAAGALAAHVASLAGLKLPIFPVRHQSLVSAPLDLSPHCPVVRIPDARLYIRPYGNAALLGAFTEKCLAQDVSAFLAGGYPRAIEDAAELDVMLTQGKRFLPVLSTSHIAEVRKGLPTCTPDGSAILGPVPGLPGLHLLAGCQAFGVAGSGGLAGLLVDALLVGQLPPQAQAFAPERWLKRTWDESTARRASESITQNYYSLPVPANRET